MRFFSWILIFILSLFVALILVLTFIQPEFKQSVGAQILTYKTRQMPVYLYVIGSFALGLGLGIIQALYTFIRSRADLFRKNRRIRELEQQLEERTGQETKGEIVSQDAASINGERMHHPEDEAV